MRTTSVSTARCLATWGTLIPELRKSVAETRLHPSNPVQPLVADGFPGFA
ncbi:SPRY domain-containing protein [Nocardia beijingensis]|uniref:Uncharacterized protein n=1 Tax=Nocardia beijingensis TaxID=95162 RepID=A0ABW7W964_9NOCA